MVIDSDHIYSITNLITNSDQIFRSLILVTILQFSSSDQQHHSLSLEDFMTHNPPKANGIVDQ